MLVRPDDTLERQNEKLVRICTVLMEKVEKGRDHPGLAYAQFERAARLEAQVRQRTLDLERTLGLLADSNAQLAEANAAAEEARANLADAVESVREGFALFDRNDVLVMSNSRFCEELSDVAERIRPGLSFEDYVRLVSRSIHLALPESDSRAAWRTRRMSQHAQDSLIFNVRLTRERWLQVGEHRTPTGGTVILQTDVSDIIRAERNERDRLMDRQARMVRATLDHLNQAVCIFDADLRLVGWNNRMERMIESLILRSQMMGIHVRTLFDRLEERIRFGPFFTREHLDVWVGWPKPRQPITFEIGQSDGTVLSVFGQAMPDRGFVISFTDVTAEREAERALREMNETLERRVHDRTEELNSALAQARLANASKTRFVAAASHDLLQPLSAAKLYVSFLQERAETSRDQETAAKAVSALASVEEIIEALLDISKLDSGQAALSVRDVPLGDVLESLRSELGPVAEAKGLTLDVVDSGHIVRSDPVFLRRILQNLVTNAIRYTEHGGVLVGARRAGSDTRIEVWDTGPGIREEDRGLIFQEFKQLGPNASGSKGLGLGLAIVERACAMLDHALDLRSTPGRGSCFSVTVPREAVARRDLRTVRVRAGELKPCAQDLIVLLVENDVELANALSLTIESWGNHVIVAESGEDALDLLDEIDIVPDRLLLDYQLGPGMTGAELYTRLTERHGPLPARIVTASRQRDIVRHCRAAGVALAQKPLDPVDLIAFLDGNAD